MNLFLVLPRLKRWIARQQSVERNAEAVDIGARVDVRGVDDLIGGHEVRSTHGRSHACQLLEVTQVVCQALVRGSGENAALKSFDQTPIDDNNTCPEVGAGQHQV